MTETLEPVAQPLGVFGSYYPATVLLPDGAADVRVLHRARVYLGTNGLTVYAKRPTTGDDGWTFQSPILFEQTPEPDWTARQRGVDVQTEAGLVVITPTGNCGCGNALKHWRPQFAHNVLAWPSA